MFLLFRSSSNKVDGKKAMFDMTGRGIAQPFQRVDNLINFQCVTSSVFQYRFSF